mmetsp:Transcript_88292/g.156325  ORF Transcript_88292/g.156325 Transcript_88292/m.156325 type:complete len:443 (-) Transcript_88292:57-1385(-)
MMPPTMPQTMLENVTVVMPASLPSQWRNAEEVNSYLIDGGLVLYIGLLVLFVWRIVCYWRCCGRWLQYANYCSLMLVLLLLLYGYDIYMFSQAALSKTGRSAWEDLPGWLRPVVLSGPVFSVLTYLMCFMQTFQHVERIREESAIKRHDRAVMIIMLPAVYGAMAMTSLTRMYKLVITPDVLDDEIEIQLMKSETCFWVGDLYESWVLYQFGKLTLELIESSIARQGRSAREEERAASRALMVAHTAVESLAWVGILSFLVVCVLQAGWSLWILCFTPKEDQVTSFKASMSQFTAAGFLASGAAIYNVFVVETTFHHFLEGYMPFLKFLTVKILVTFAFFQKGFFKAAVLFQDNLLPGLKDVPIIGEIVNFPPVKFEIFYASLLIIECFLVAIMHLWAWNVSEEWYDELEYDRSGDISGGASRSILEGQVGVESGSKKYGSM